ncbi:MAG: hypothetical protein WCO51_04965 [bacterium]
MDSDDNVRNPACQLAITLPSNMLQDKERVIVNYLTEWFEQLDPQLIGLDEYAPLAAMYSKCGEDFKGKYEELLLGCIKHDANSMKVDQIAACTKALAQEHSPLFTKLIEWIGEAGYFQLIRKTAAALRTSLKNEHDEKWLEEQVLQLPYQTSTGTAVLGSTLGYVQCMDSAWQFAQAQGEDSLSLSFLSSLACGGNSEAVYILSQLEKSLYQSIQRNESNTTPELLHAWSEMQRDLLSSLSIWAYQPTACISIRWKSLLSMLRIGKDNYFPTQGALIGMANLCYAKQYPVSFT